MKQIPLVYCSLVEICFLSVTATSEWTDKAAFFTIHQTVKTWNEARAICHGVGEQLLSIQNVSAWEMWTYLLDVDLNDNMRSSSTYWFGLHSPDVAAPNVSYYWDTCEEADYVTPVTDDFIVTDEQCAYIWINREIFVGIFQDMWLKGRMCNETQPFICMRNDSDTSCISSCDEMIIPSTDAVCALLCADSSCTARYVNEMCHFWSSEYMDNNSFSVCYLPSLDFVPNICDQYTDDTDYSITDNNINVTDTSCNVPPITATTAVNSASTKSSPPIITPSTVNPASTDSITQQITPSTENGCICSCQKLWTFLATPKQEVANLTVEQKVENIVQELTVDKKNVSSSTRRYISVMDYRASSVGIGAIAGAIIFSIIGIIVIIDLSRLWHEIKYILRKLYMFLRRYTMEYRNPIDALVNRSSVFPVALANGKPTERKKHRKKSSDKLIKRPMKKQASYLERLLRSNSVGDCMSPSDISIEKQNTLKILENDSKTTDPVYNITLEDDGIKNSENVTSTTKTPQSVDTKAGKTASESIQTLAIHNLPSIRINDEEKEKHMKNRKGAHRTQNVNTNWHKYF